MPSTFPIDFSLNFNYAVIAVGVVLAYATATWFLPGPRPFNARAWFKGPNLRGLSTELFPDAGPGASIAGGSINGKDIPLPLGV